MSSRPITYFRLARDPTQSSTLSTEFVLVYMHKLWVDRVLNIKFVSTALPNLVHSSCIVLCAGWYAVVGFISNSCRVGSLYYCYVALVPPTLTVRKCLCAVSTTNDLLLMMFMGL